MAKAHTDPVVRLHQWVLEWLPGYGQTWSQFNKTPNRLLVSHSHVLDRVFIEQLWLYSKLAGPDKFPCGLFKHPFDDGWKKAVYEASGLSLLDGHFRSVARAAVVPEVQWPLAHSLVDPRLRTASLAAQPPRVALTPLWPRPPAHQRSPRVALTPLWPGRQHTKGLQGWL